jgi:hypothetical protein
MKTIICYIEGEDPIEIPIKKVMYRCVDDYKLDHKRFRAFQFDGIKPSYYSKDYVENEWFFGYLITKTKDGVRKVVDCKVQVRL